jgi:peptide/nickel transport system substrate-binding protein
MPCVRWRIPSLSLVLTFALAACQPSPASPTGGAAPPPAPTGPTGTLTVADVAPIITTYDPGLANDSGTLRFFFPAFDALTWLDKDGRTRPGLAREWKTLNETTWEFTLGEYQFHHRRAVTVEDVLGTYTRYRDPAKALRAAAAFATVDQVRAAGPKTVQLTTKVPDPTLPAMLSTAMVLPMAELNQQGESEFFKRPLGSGPFRVEQADFQSALRFVAMGTDFPGSRGVPNFREVVVRFVPDVATRIAAIQTGEVDLALRLPSDSQRPLENAGFKVVRDLNERAVSFLLDPVNGPTRDVRVRQAINYAVDKETILKGYYGGYGRVDSQLLAPNVLGYNPDLKPYPYDGAKAKQLLAEAGYPNGYETRITCINTPSAPRDLCVIIADQLREVGIRAEIVVLDVAAWAADFFGPPERRPGIWAQAVNWDQTFEANAIWRWYSSDIPANAGRRYFDEEFDRLYQEAKRTFDRDKRAERYRLAGLRLHETAPVLFGWQDADMHASKKDISVFTKGWFADFYLTARRG